MTGGRGTKTGNEGGEIEAFVAFVPEVRNKSAKPDRDALIAQLAARQYGVVSSEQLRAIGISRTGIHRRVRGNRLHPLHRGVYSVGHIALSERGRWMAAVLACGERAVVSHLSAAELWGIRRQRRPTGGESGLVHITVPSTAGIRQRRGIALHRSSTLTTSRCTRRDRIPVTTPDRTLRDIRSLLSPAQFTAAVREAEFLRLPIGRVSSDGARTELEARMLAVCRCHRLPTPSVNEKVDRFVVDFLWPERSLVVEVDGWESHRTRSAFEEDRLRDARLAVLGYEVVRFTWRHLTRDSHGVAKTIRALLR